MGHSHWVQRQELREKLGFLSCQQRMSAGKAELHFPECSWPSMLPRKGKGLSCQLLPAPKLFLLLFICGFSALNCLPRPLNRGIIAPPAHPPEPNSLPGFIYEQHSSRTHPAAPSPPVQAAGGDGQRQARATSSEHGCGVTQRCPSTSSCPHVSTGHRMMLLLAQRGGSSRSLAKP